MIVVTGATGRLGRRTVEELIQRVDAAEVVAVGRNPDGLAGLGVRTRYADFADPAALLAAFDGADRALIMSLGMVPDRLALQTAAVQAAVRAGVGHLVYPSLTRPGDPGRANPLLPDHRDTERLLAGTGVPFTALRFNIWPEVLVEYLPIAPAWVAAGELPSNAGAGRTAYLTRDDSAAALAAVLTGGAGELGPVIEVTGTEAVTDADLAAALTAATGRPVAYREYGDDEIAAALTAQGIEPWLADAWGGAGADRRQGWFDLTTHAFERLTGRPPTTLADFLADRRANLTEGFGHSA